jgi:hypothetical protein
MQTKLSQRHILQANEGRRERPVRRIFWQDIRQRISYRIHQTNASLSARSTLWQQPKSKLASKSKTSSISHIKSVLIRSKTFPRKFSKSGEEIELRTKLRSEFIQKSNFGRRYKTLNGKSLLETAFLHLQINYAVRLFLFQMFSQITVIANKAPSRAISNDNSRYLSSAK